MPRKYGSHPPLPIPPSARVRLGRSSRMESKRSSFTGGTISREARVARDVKRLQGKLTKLKRLDDATTGTLTYRSGVASRVTSLDNQQSANVYEGCTAANIELALAQTKYFNPSVPGTLTTGSSAAGTYQRNTLIESFSSRLKIRNNYQVPCELVVYLASVRDDTGQSVKEAWTAGVPDGSNLTDTTDLNQYPTDYNLVKDLWHLKKLYGSTLESGKGITVSHTIKDVEYDSATFDTHSLQYQKEFKAFQFLIVMKGCIAHDSTLANEIGVISSLLDIEQVNTVKVKYAAGINITYTYVTADYDTFSNAAHIANKPLSGSQAAAL